MPVAKSYNPFRSLNQSKGWDHWLFLSPLSLKTKSERVLEGPMLFKALPKPELALLIKVSLHLWVSPCVICNKRNGLRHAPGSVPPFSTPFRSAMLCFLASVRMEPVRLSLRGASWLLHKGDKLSLLLILSAFLVSLSHTGTHQAFPSGGHSVGAGNMVPTPLDESTTQPGTHSLGGHVRKETGYI